VSYSDWKRNGEPTLEESLMRDIFVALPCLFSKLLPMRTCWLVVFAITGSVAAAEESRWSDRNGTAVVVPTFSSPAIAAGRTSGALGAPLSRSRLYFPNANTDLLAPISTQQKILQQFRGTQLDWTKTTTIGSSPNLAFPVSAPDFIGPKLDRDQLIEAFKAKIEMSKRPTG
jgi:hypothetical protein